MPQPGYAQQTTPPPNPQVQQQIDDERRQAAADAADKAKQRQQAEAAARARQQQAELKAQADAKVKAAADEKKNREATRKLLAEPALVAVLGSDPRDITALVVGKDTPTVIRDLNDQPMFQTAPVACFPFGGLTTQPGGPEMRFLAGVMADILRKGGLSTASVTPRVCDSSEIDRYDLVIFSSGQVASASLESLTPVVNALEGKRFVAFGTFTVSSFDANEKAKIDEAHAEESRKAAERKAAIDSFQLRDPAVISAIYLNSPASVVCLMAPDVEGVTYMAKRGDSPFASLVDGGSTFLVVASANAIFLDLKKHDCFAAIAPAGALKAVVAALTRDKVPVEIDGGTLASGTLANWKVIKGQDLLAEQTQQATLLKAQRKADAEQQTEDEQRQALEAEQRKNDEAVRQQKIQAMRKLVSSKANAVVDGFSGKLASYMTTVRDQIIAKQRPTDQALSAFQPWADQYATSIKQGWQFQPIRATVEDYGRAQWMNRTIEAISVRVEFPMMNRVIGQKATACVDFVWINDEEFDFERRPIAVSCDRYGATFTVWAQQNDFTSQWTLLQ
jgi:multidrug efflux pump subunit AcrA (membrane-fusion protein)